MPVWINKAANLGKSTLLSPLCWALPQNVQLRGAGEEIGDACAPLGGLTCIYVVGRFWTLGSWSGILSCLDTLWSLAPTVPCSAWAWMGDSGACQPWLPPSLQDLFCLALSVAVSGLWTTRSALSSTGLGPVSLGSCHDTMEHERSRQSTAAAASAAAAASEILFPRVPASIPWRPSSPSWP